MKLDRQISIHRPRRVLAIWRILRKRSKQQKMKKKTSYWKIIIIRIFRLKTCIMKHRDHVTQHKTMRSEPLNWLFSVTEEAIVGWIVNRGRQKLLIIGPLYSVMVITPAKEIKVPRTFDKPRGFLTSRTSNLSATAIMKVREAMQLTMEAIKVGEVYLKLTKYIFSVKLTLQFYLIQYKLSFHTCIYV